jgi:zinc transport system substrate-binding protein
MRTVSQVIGFLLVALAFAEGRLLHADEIKVVASIKPVHSLVAGVMAGVGAPALLVNGARSPHDYSMRPSDARTLQEADVVFWVGADLETFLVKPTAALSSGARVVALSKSEGVGLLPTREGGLWEEAAYEPGEQQGQAGAEHAEHGQFDMHLWLDPANAQAMVGAIVTALRAADPDNALIYRDNGERLRARLAELEKVLAERLGRVGHRPFVVFHDAYRYLESRYHLNALGAITVDPRRRPGAHRLAQIQQQLEELDAACVFFEPQFEPALVDTVIEGTSARKAVLDPLGADLDPGADHYFRLMDGLAAALVGCLRAAPPG